MREESESPTHDPLPIKNCLECCAKRLEQDWISALEVLIIIIITIIIIIIIIIIIYYLLSVLCHVAWLPKGRFSIGQLQ